MQRNNRFLVQVASLALAVVLGVGSALGQFVQPSGGSTSGVGLLASPNTWTATQTITPVVNTSALVVSGFSLTNSNAQSLLDLAGTWNTSGTPSGIKLNVTDTASNAASLLIQAQVGGVDKFKVVKDGLIRAGSFVSADSGFFDVYTSLTAAQAGTSSAARLRVNAASGAIFGSAMLLGWADNASPITGSVDLSLLRDAADTLALRRATNAQALRVYGSWTDASNKDYASLSKAAGGDVLLAAQGLGTGTGGSLQFAVPVTAGAGVAASNVAKFNGGSGHLLWNTDNTYDIGASGATRPRDYFGAGKITSAGATSGVGYATGAGGTVTQATSRSTGVTLSKVTGQITTTADSIAALGIVTFTVTNTAVAATDVIVLSKVSGDADTSAWVSAVAAGSFNISLRNNDAVAADTTVFVVNFAILKGVTS